MPHVQSKTFRSSIKKPKCLFCGDRKNVVREAMEFHCTYCGWDCPIDCEDHAEAGVYHGEY